MAGYSGTPLVRKLGFREGYRIRTSRAPPDYRELVSPLPEGVLISPSIRSNIDIWHCFANSRAELARELPRARNDISQDGMIWVSWPKKASKMATDVTEDVVRENALPLGLVDVKVCAVDEVWSGLKLVIRKEFKS